MVIRQRRLVAAEQALAHYPRPSQGPRQRRRRVSRRTPHRGRDRIGDPFRSRRVGSPGGSFRRTRRRCGIRGASVRRGHVGAQCRGGGGKAAHVRLGGRGRRTRLRGHRHRPIRRPARPPERTLPTAPPPAVSVWDWGTARVLRPPVCSSALHSPPTAPGKRSTSASRSSVSADGCEGLRHADNSTPARPGLGGRFGTGWDKPIPYVPAVGLVSGGPGG